MRKIVKAEPIQEFTNHIRRDKPKRWEDFKPDIRVQSRDHILREEQYELSAYTEKNISKSKLHIDHFRKRVLFPKLTFDWNNFLVDEKEANYGADYKDNHISKEDYKLIVNPVIDDPSHYFGYQVNGEIIPALELSDSDKKRAKKTIEIFNLNHSALKHQRKEFITQVKNSLEGGLTPEGILELWRTERYPFPSSVEFLVYKIHAEIF